MTKSKEKKSYFKYPEYDTYLSFKDISEITNFRALNTTSGKMLGETFSKAEVGEFDISLLTLSLGLKKINEQDVTDTNIEDLLRANLVIFVDDKGKEDDLDIMNSVIMLSRDMWSKAVKKK